MADDTESAGLWMVKEYIQRRHATIATQVDCQPIYELCAGAEWMPGSSRMMRWWYQDAVSEEE